MNHELINPIAKKLLIKPGKRWLFFNAPENYLVSLEPLPEGVTVAYEAGGEFDGVQLFVKNSTELSSSLKVIVPILKADTIFWVTYPKKSSGIKSNLEMMSSWDELAKYGLRGVASAAVNETWTALRFRPVGQSKISDTGNDKIKQNEYAAYINVDQKVVTLPPDLKDILQQTPDALAFYLQLSYSNKKEYVLWILTAKQEKTRNERLVKLVEKLLAKKKNPAEK
jgi:hypothetical protein